MRSIAKMASDIVCCRMRKFGRWIILVLVLFVVGNFLLLRPMLNRDSGNGLKIDQLSFKTTKHTKEQNGNVDQEKNDFFDKTVDISKVENHVQQARVASEKSTFNKATNLHTEEHQTPDGKFKIALLIMACNRVEVKRCIDGIFKYKPADYPMQVIVSQDCGHAETANVIRSYGDKIKFIQQPDLGPVKGVPNNMHRFMGYYKISRHFKFALGKVFDTTDSDSVIIVEDDIDIAPDFFDYFLALRPLLDQDKSLFCVSAWNDNGKEDTIDPSAIDLLYRSDFFPGLGWMMTRKLWNDIGRRWPKGFWDDWMRAPEQRQGRACIRPEISRTKTFGRIGVSQGQFYDQYLKFIKLNSKPYPFRDYDVSYLMKSKYDDEFIDKVYSIREVPTNEATTRDEDVRITYRNNYEFERMARQFGLMSDFKAGVPRTAYKGVVTFYKNNHRIYFAPPRNWQGYTAT